MKEETPPAAGAMSDDYTRSYHYGVSTRWGKPGELNRSSIGIELNPEYIKIIKKRLQSDSQLDTGIVSYRFEKVLT